MMMWPLSRVGCKAGFNCTQLGCSFGNVSKDVTFGVGEDHLAARHFSWCVFSGQQSAILTCQPFFRWVANSVWAEFPSFQEKRLKELTEENEVLHSGLEVVEEARKWYFKRITAVQEERLHLKQSDHYTTEEVTHQTECYLITANIPSKRVPPTQHNGKKKKKKKTTTTNAGWWLDKLITRLLFFVTHAMVSVQNYWVV